MDIRYFQDTDTLLLIFNRNEVVETYDLSENMVFDRDINGNPVALTIEHATTVTNVNGLSFHQINGDTVRELVAI